MSQEFFAPQGADPLCADGNSVEKTIATFREWACRYAATHDGRFLARLIEHFGDAPLSEIDQTAIDCAAKTLYAGAAPSTVNRQCHSPISAILKYAAARGLCPIRGQIKRPAQPKHDRLRWLSPAEASRLVGACSEHMRPILLLLLMTTCHPSEAIFLDWCQVDLTRHRVRFPRGGKRNARSVSLHPAVVAALARLPHREGAVFRCPDGRPYRKERGAAAVKTAFTAACRRAKIKDFTIRDVRVTSAVWRLACTRDLDGLMRRGGWRGDPRTADRYKRISTADLDALRASLRDHGWDSARLVPGPLRR